MYGEFAIASCIFLFQKLKIFKIRMVVTIKYGPVILDYALCVIFDLIFCFFFTIYAMKIIFKCHLRFFYSFTFGLFKGYHIHINGNHHCTLRYKQLRHLHDQLRKIFSHDTIPEFPSKKLLPLTTLQLEERRLHLEKYLQSSKTNID